LFFLWFWVLGVGAENESGRGGDGFGVEGWAEGGGGGEGVEEGG